MCIKCTHNNTTKGLCTMTNATQICFELIKQGKKPTKAQLAASREYVRQQEREKLKALKPTIEAIKRKGK